MFVVQLQVINICSFRFKENIYITVSTFVKMYGSIFECLTFGYYEERTASIQSTNKV